MQIVDTSRIAVRGSGNRDSRNKVVKPREEVLNCLYNNLVPIIDMKFDRVLDSSKYVKLARYYKYSNYRFCKYYDLVRLGLSDSFTEYQRGFLKNEGAVIAIFNTMNNKPTSIIFRSISHKEFMDYSLVYNIYGFDLMDDSFTFGMPVVLTEGVYDADSVRFIYKNTLAVLTSNITVMQANILNSLTNRFIIAFDQDDAGESGYTKAIQRLDGEVRILDIYESDKDLGIMEELRDSSFEFDARKSYYTDRIYNLIDSEQDFTSIF